MGVSEMDGLKCELIILGISYQRSGGRASRTIITFAGRRVRRGGVYRAHHNKWSVRPSDWARNATVRTQTQNPHSTNHSLWAKQKIPMRPHPWRIEGEKERRSFHGRGWGASRVK